MDEEVLHLAQLFDHDAFQDAQNFFNHEEELFRMSPSPSKNRKLSRRISKRKSCVVLEEPLKEITNLNVQPISPQCSTPSKQTKQPSSPLLFSPPSALPQRYLMDTTSNAPLATPSPLPIYSKKMAQSVFTTPSKEFTYNFQLFIPSSLHTTPAQPLMPIEDIPSTPLSRKIVKRDKTPSRQILLPITPRKSTIPSTPNSQRKIVHAKRTKSSTALDEFASLNVQTPSRRESFMNTQQQTQNIKPVERRFSVFQPSKSQPTNTSSRLSLIQSNTSSRYQSIKDMPLTPLLTRKRKLDELNSTSTSSILLPMDTVSTPKNMPPSYTPFKKIKKVFYNTPKKL